MREFHSGNFLLIDTLDDDHGDDIGEEDLSWNILVICVWLYLLFCYLIMVFDKSMELLVWFFIILMDLLSSCLFILFHFHFFIYYKLFLNIYKL